MANKNTETMTKVNSCQNIANKLMTEIASDLAGFNMTHIIYQK